MDRIDEESAVAEVETAEANGGQAQLTLRRSGTDRDVFAKARAFTDAALLRRVGCYPFYQPIERSQGPMVRVNGKDCVMLGSNNYLGLTAHPEVRKAAADAALEHGPSLTGSRLLNGTHVLHNRLEEALAEFLGKPACLVFATGYQANIGVLSALLGRNDVAFLDRFDHASIVDGTRVGKGTTVVYKHNDMADLEEHLAQAPERSGRLVMVDGIFSMEGDICPLPDVLEVAARHDARVVVDDAHALGVIGPGGRGTAHHFGVVAQTDLIVGTFSKSLASIGGYVVGDEDIIDFIRHVGRSVLFSASMPPPSAAAALKALEILKREPERVERVNQNARYLRDSLCELGFEVGPSETPIIPVVIGNEMTTLRVWRELLDEGVYVNAVIYPAVPKGRGLLRTSCSAEHTREQIDRALSVLGRLAKRLIKSHVA